MNDFRSQVHVMLLKNKRIYKIQTVKREHILKQKTGRQNIIGYEITFERHSLKLAKK